MCIRDRSLDSVIVFVAFLNDQHVGISGAGFAFTVLNGQRVGNIQASVNGVVAVDDGHVHVGQAHGELTLSLIHI